jgi:hypothetical protein
VDRLRARGDLLRRSATGELGQLGLVFLDVGGVVGCLAKLVDRDASVTEREIVRFSSISITIVSICGIVDCISPPRSFRGVEATCQYPSPAPCA